MLTAALVTWLVTTTVTCVLFYLDGREWERLTIDWMKTSNRWQEQSQKWEALAKQMQRTIESAGEPMTGNVGMTEGDESEDG
jgi:uncharacterized membrane protein